MKPIGGLQTITNFEVLERFRPAATLVNCRLETGRTHQIRVHACHIGSPIIGDPVYGSGKMREGVNDELRTNIRLMGRQALHAGKLSFKHPKTKEVCCFTSQIPDDMRSLTELLKSNLI